jgi:hypothetical protein
MRRIGLLASLASVAVLIGPASAPADLSRAPDCRFEGAREYEDFGRIRVFTAGRVLYGCLTDVGRAHRLNTGTIRARTSANRAAVFGAGDWVGFPSRDRKGRVRVRAIDLRTGRTNGAPSPAVATALVVNFDGTLAWVAGTEVRTRAAGGESRSLGSDPAVERDFLGLEKDQGCAVTWKVGGEQRSASIYCTRP